MAVTMQEDGTLERMERFLPSLKLNNAIDMVFGPDGDLYLLEYGTNWFSQNSDARLVHLKYIAGNRQPVAMIEVDKQVGAAPLTVSFDGSGSIEYDGEPMALQGTYVPGLHIGKGEAGVYIFTASYSDRGAPGAQVLTARKVVQLRHPKVEAEDFDVSNDAKRFTVTPDMAPGIEVAMNLVLPENAQYVGYKSLDLTGINSLNLAALAMKPFMEGGSIELRLDSPTGEMLASTQVEAVLGLSPVGLPIAAQTGKHDVYLVFKTADGGSGIVCAVDWIEFVHGKSL